MKSIFIFAGESSGDLHGSRLMHSLQEFASFKGVGGPLMRQQGLEPFLPMEAFMVMGFSDVIQSFPKLWSNFYKIRDEILKTDPHCTLLIDYPGFNLRLAKALRKKGYKGKIVQYICPTVWAHGKNRIRTLSENFDLLLTIFPFETSFFSQTPLKTYYAGNPLIETLQKHPYTLNWKQKLGIPDSPLVAIFPGSRPGEIERHTLPLLQAASELKDKKFALSCTHDSLAPYLVTAINKSPLNLNEDVFLVPRHYTYDLMQDCQAAIAKSGTVTLELALHEKPTLAVYQLTSFNYFIAKHLLRLSLPHYCIVNLLAKKEVFPEIISTHLDAKGIAQKMHAILNNKEAIALGCREVRELLAGPQTAGSHIQELLA